MRILVLGDLVRLFLRSGAGYPVRTDGGGVSRRGLTLAGKGSGVVVVKFRAKVITCCGSNVSYRVIFIWAINDHARLFVRPSGCSVIWSCLMYSFQCAFLPIAYLWSPDHTTLDCWTVPMAISIDCFSLWCFFAVVGLACFYAMSMMLLNKRPNVLPIRIELYSKRAGPTTSHRRAIDSRQRI